MPGGPVGEELEAAGRVGEGLVGVACKGGGLPHLRFNNYT